MKDTLKMFFRNSLFEHFLLFPFFRKLISSNREYKPNSFRKVVRNGIKYQLDLSEYMEHSIFFNSSNEERTQMNSNVMKGMVVFDIGANVGDTTLNFAKHVGDKGKVFAFEPVDVNYAKLKNNISLNCFTSIAAFQIALSDKEEELLFGYSWNNNSSGIQMNKSASNLGSTTNNIAKACTLDGFIKEHNVEKVDFIKIDVEGFENYVLIGAEASLKKFMPILYLEVSDVPLSLQDSSAEKLMKYVESIGYKMKDVRTGQPILFNKDYTGVHMDILCTPKKK